MSQAAVACARRHERPAGCRRHDAHSRSPPAARYSENNGPSCMSMAWFSEIRPCAVPPVGSQLAIAQGPLPAFPDIGDAPLPRSARHAGPRDRPCSQSRLIVHTGRARRDFRSTRSEILMSRTAHTSFAARELVIVPRSASSSVQSGSNSPVISNVGRHCPRMSANVHAGGDLGVEAPRPRSPPCT